MNNAKVALDNIYEEEVRQNIIPDLRKKEEEIVSIIAALRDVSESTSWNLLKEKVFDDVAMTISERLRKEATKSEVNHAEIYRLQGQLAWAQKYAQLESLTKVYETELQRIKQYLHEKRKTGD